MRIRYGYQLTRLPEKCACGAYFDLQHALSCEKGGFLTLRHNMIREVTARLLNEIFHDVRVESQFKINRASEARLDISARSVWITGQKAFLDEGFSTHWLDGTGIQTFQSRTRSTKKRRNDPTTREYSTLNKEHLLLWCSVQQVAWEENATDSTNKYVSSLQKSRKCQFSSFLNVCGESFPIL